MLKWHWCRTLWNIIRPAPACSIHILSSLYWRYLPTSKIVGQILILPRRPRKTSYRSYKYSPSCIGFPSGLLFCKLALKVNNSQLRQTFSGDLSAKKYPTRQHSGESKNFHQPIMQICRERDYSSVIPDYLFWYQKWFLKVWKHRSILQSTTEELKVNLMSLPALSGKWKSCCELKLHLMWHLEPRIVVPPNR